MSSRFFCSHPGPFAGQSALWLSLICSSMSVPDGRAELTLADRGKSQYRIVIPEAALPSERFAAEELALYLEKIGGARLPIFTDASLPSQYEILLGDSRHSSRLGPSLDLAKLEPDGFLLRTHGRRLIIAGGRPRGTLNGVHSFLENQLGVRWFTPELEQVPARTTIKLPAIDQTFVPALEYREVFWTEMMRDADFASRHRLNGDHYQFTEKHGGRFAVYFPFVHSLDDLIPRSLFAEHPEYFPLINGQRKEGYVQRCLSNPAVLKLAKATVRHWIKDHPEASIISVSQNDTENYCCCPECKGLDDREGSPAASLLRFVNSIAQDIEADYPRLRIDTLAYQYTRKPPRTIRPHRNVILRLCSIECCFAHPLEACASRENQRFREDIFNWQPVAPLLYVWDYTPNFGHYQQPFPNLDALQPNVRFFVEHGVKGLFEQGNYSPGGGGELGPLRAYLLAELLWNPDTDVPKATREFVQAYYGQAGPQVLAYLNLLEQQVRDPSRHAHIFDSPKAAYLNPAFIQAADKLLAAGEPLAENDAVRLRVQSARLPLWYVQLATQTVSGQDRPSMLHRFLAVARKAGVSHISEGKTLDEWAKEMESR